MYSKIKYNKFYSTSEISNVLLIFVYIIMYMYYMDMKQFTKIQCQTAEQLIKQKF